MLVDRHDYWLIFDYINTVSDPNDPEIKRARAERLKYGIKPPPLPILRPVAQRRPEITEALAESYRKQQPAAPEEKPTRTKGGLSLLRSQWGA